jgi:hypothetical protein
MKSKQQSSTQLDPKTEQAPTRFIVLEAAHAPGRRIGLRY